MVLFYIQGRASNILKKKKQVKKKPVSVLVFYTFLCKA
jgi:hypothetical protein